MMRWPRQAFGDLTILMRDGGSNRARRVDGITNHRIATYLAIKEGDAWWVYRSAPFPLVDCVQQMFDPVRRDMSNGGWHQTYK